MAYKEGRTARKSKPETAAFSYELFELAQTLRIRPRTDSIGGSDAQRHGGSSHLPFIQLASWHEDAFGSLLVLLCSNGALLVWSKDCAGNPFTKQISWYQNPSRAIKAICLDPSGCWLVCACMDTHLYIVPLSAAIKTEGRKSVSNCPWAKDDITKVLCSEKRASLKVFDFHPAGLPCSVAWLPSLADLKLGEVVFVDLCNGKAILSVDLKEGITSLEMMQDKQHQSTCVMISTVSGEAWQLILESTSLPRRRFSMSSDPMTSPSVASALGYEMIGMMAIPLESFQAVTEWQDRLNPMPVKSAVGETHFSVQHARKQVFIGAHNLRTDILQVYDTDVAHLPMFIYQLRASTSKLVLTDRLLFTVVQPEQDKIAAERALQLSKYEHAMKLYQLSKCPFHKRVAQFAKHGRIGDILTHLRQVLNKHSDFHTAERKQLSDFTMYCFVQQIMECSTQPQKGKELSEAFRSPILVAKRLSLLSTVHSKQAHPIPMAFNNQHYKKNEHEYYRLFMASSWHQSGCTGVTLFAITLLSDARLLISIIYGLLLICDNGVSSQFINDNFDYDEGFALELLSIHGLKEHIFDLAKVQK
ncbi:predicted protein [Nematostella vectensis]|uniref:Uncharacterized protein n=1 Tax=Nematostella vectensis TaxID=45351 RepID=A7RT82_NEMVE|nr:predicted protein [Nematostella vectensis]|eukprot:XP_001637481.1 predicted protein [Nematostella vectensis]